MDRSRMGVIIFMYYFGNFLFKLILIVQLHMKIRDSNLAKMTD